MPDSVYHIDPVPRTLLQGNAFLSLRLAQSCHCPCQENRVLYLSFACSPCLPVQHSYPFFLTSTPSSRFDITSRIFTGPTEYQTIHILTKIYHFDSESSYVCQLPFYRNPSLCLLTVTASQPACISSVRLILVPVHEWAHLIPNLKACLMLTPDSTRSFNSTSS